MTDTDLLDQFTGAFERLDLDHLLTFDPIPEELVGSGDDSSLSPRKWHPAAILTAISALTELQGKLPGRLPPLYERLVLSYRWLEIDLDGFVKLLANPPGPSIAPLIAAITADPVLVEVLFPHGLVPFGRASGGSYDPVCFDMNHRQANGDCPVVRVEHEAVLCNLRLGESWQIASSFRSLIEAVVLKAESSR